MKKMLFAAAALAMFASPALAQTGSWQSGSIPAAPFFGQAAPYGAYAQQRQRAAVTTPYAQQQHLGGDYVGTDPDPNVRLNLLKDEQSRD